MRDIIEIDEIILFPKRSGKKWKWKKFVAFLFVLAAFFVMVVLVKDSFRY
jgi:hypothetical protein